MFQECLLEVLKLFVLHSYSWSMMVSSFSRVPTIIQDKPTTMDDSINKYLKYIIMSPKFHTLTITLYNYTLHAGEVEGWDRYDKAVLL